MATGTKIWDAPTTNIAGAEKVPLGKGGATPVTTTLNAIKTWVLSGGAVLYNAVQSLTATQKQQALSNIGGASSEDVSALQAKTNNVIDPVVSQHLNELRAEVEGLKASLESLHSIYIENLDCGNIPMVCGQPLVLLANGVPADGNKPTNWNGAWGEWTGVPSFIGQFYIDLTNHALYQSEGYEAVSNWHKV